MPLAEGHDRAGYDARLETELDVIITMGFPGYFLIVADFINWAKDHGIPVGPGRGSGAGSLVAWALGITDLDPLPYDLLFERFLNPERVSMPDFDIDFCMDRRDEVIDYVAAKYGRDRVSQIITYGTMAAKAVVRDTGRVLGFPYGFVDGIAKLIPLTLGVSLDDALGRSEAARKNSELASSELIAALQRRGRRPRPARPRAAARGPHPQRRQARRRRGDRADAAERFLPAVRRTRRRRPWPQPGHPVRQGRRRGGRPGEVRLPRPAHADDHRLGGEGDQRAARSREASRRSTSRRCRSTTRRPTSCSRAATPSRCSSSNRAACANCSSARGPTASSDLIALVSLYRPGPMDLIPDFIERKHGRAEVELSAPAAGTGAGADLRRDRVPGTGDADRPGAGRLFARRRRPAAPRDGQEEGRGDGEGARQVRGRRGRTTASTRARRRRSST